jgi:hypothetical protein
MHFADVLLGNLTTTLTLFGFVIDVALIRIAQVLAVKILCGLIHATSGAMLSAFHFVYS